MNAMTTSLSRLLENSIDRSASGRDSLEIMGGPEDGRIFPLHTFPVSLGRAPDNAVVLGLDGTVSRRHAVIERSGKALVLRDQGSRHGTLVNGVPVHDQVEIVDGSLLVLGGTVLCLHVAGGDEFQ
jgi:pSer/pThr/pTyr-binding forkhead associated (FHA) protein